MAEQYVNTLKPGDPFRDWLVEVLGDRVHNPACRVRVYRISPASHTVCRYAFSGEKFSVVGKFFGEPTGVMRHYNEEKAMRNEYQRLKQASMVIHVPRPITCRGNFHNVVITDYIKGVALRKYLRHEHHLYDRLSSVAALLRRLHDGTRGPCNIQREFGQFHKVLDQNRLDADQREQFNHLLGGWWDAGLLHGFHGSLIHGDATPANYIHVDGKVYAIDFENGLRNAHPIHDLGVLSAEMKHFFASRFDDGERSEPYIGHLLWRYSRGEDDFYKITDVLPFFIAFGYMRIARLGWAPSHREYLIGEAKACLRSRLT
ncbi:aminoglycoside phosphotransferase family protein [Methanoculleus sp. FWC-SCC1]|uniref:Aminoglycoside phosphotransferase family protein n=1 Tax=Methanoculleus frigidifontis TaxID=2584085 RepID=A0ABT8MAL3_9EURY|nr:phosphotransferase [Methanoculleus sp. FWC-SCC1]MDN7024979.1 aminoglycoside phosphotransferase family protein [Methanoculleus sp. FWC-SCC1]